MLIGCVVELIGWTVELLGGEELPGAEEPLVVEEPLVAAVVSAATCARIRLARAMCAEAPRPGVAAAAGVPIAVPAGVAAGAGALPTCVAATGVGDGVAAGSVEVTGVVVGNAGGGGATCVTTGAFASWFACAPPDRELPLAPVLRRGRPYEAETTGIRRCRTIRLTRVVCSTLTLRTDRLRVCVVVVGVVAATGAAWRAAAAGESRWSVGIATCGKRASGIASAGIVTATAGGCSAARIAATPVLA